MSQHLLYANGKARFLDLDMNRISRTELAELLEEFEKLHGDCARLVKLDYQESSAGIIYEWGLAGPDGAWFCLYPMPWQHKEEVEKAKEGLFRSSDVVRINVNRIEKFV